MTSRVRRARCTPSASASGDPYVLHHDEAWGVGVATAFRTAATRLGMNVAGMDEWDRRARDYTRLAQRVAARARTASTSPAMRSPTTARGSSRICVGKLGPDFPILSPDGFNEPAALVEGAGARAEGVVITLAAIPTQELPPAGLRFAREFEQRFGALPCCYSVYSAQATHVLLDAIAASDGTRAGVLRNLFRTRVRGGLLGDFAIDRYWRHDADGDRRVPGARARLRLATTIRPSTDLLDRR